MQSLLRLSGVIDWISEKVGQFLIWLVLAAVLISAGNAVIRKLLSTGSNAWLETQWYLFAAVFMLGAGYAFLHNAHVRIDFLSGRLSARTRNIIDVIGIVVFMFPLCYMLITISWPLFVNAWTSGEMSQNAGGLIRWPMYALIPLGFTLLGLQGTSELIKRLAFLAGVAPDAIGHEATESKDEIGHEIEEHAAHAKEEIR